MTFTKRMKDFSPLPRVALRSSVIEQILMVGEGEDSPTRCVRSVRLPPSPSGPSPPPCRADPRPRRHQPLVFSLLPAFTPATRLRLAQTWRLRRAPLRFEPPSSSPSRVRRAPRRDATLGSASRGKSRGVPASHPVGRPANEAPYKRTTKCHGSTCSVRALLMRLF